MQYYAATLDESCSGYKQLNHGMQKALPNALGSDRDAK